MRVHYLQHVPFEGPGSIEFWAMQHHYPLSRTRFYAGDQLPGYETFECLIILGGPMSVHDGEACRWLVVEREYIHGAIERDKIVLGICLGAQLVASVLGATVYRGAEKEIGWFPIQIAPELKESDIGVFFGEEIMAFHWHGETFSIPEGATPLGASEACVSQGFIYRERVLALQFHMEITHSGVEALALHCADDLVNEPYIQSADEMLSEPTRFNEINRRMSAILDWFALPTVIMSE